MPCAASSDISLNAVYVRARHTGNPRFFEQTRQRLELVLHDRNLVANVGAPSGDEGGDVAVVQALEAVLQAQCTALGFVSDRQFQKALALGELSVAIVDTLAATWQWGESSAIFWQLLVRANLGGSQARFGKHEQATGTLRQGLQMAEGATGLGARERVLLGVLYAHLVRVCLDAGDLNEASRLAESEIEAFERHIWELSDAREDREIQALVLATSYMTRGLCDIRKCKYDTGQMWFGRAQDCVEKHADLGPDSIELLAQIVEQAEHCRSLQL
jgi:hypothetical protein